MTVKSYLIIALSVSLFFQTSALAANDQADFYVSPSGSDKNPGTIKKPFATLAKARDAVREKLADTDNDITVMLRGGKYFLSDTVIFTLADSGKDGHKVIYRNYPGEEPVFTSGVKIAGWKKMKENLPSLSNAAKGKIWAADVPKGLEKVYSLYDGEKILPRARSGSFKPQIKPADWPSTMRANGEKYPPEYMYTLPCPPGFIRQYENLPDVELRIVPMVNWTMNILPLKSVDEKNNLLTTAIDGSYFLFDQVKKRCFPNGACWIENTVDFLDKPGCWVFDSKARKIYLWPDTDKPSKEISAASLKQFILVEGQINNDQPSDIPAKNIVFQGLTFEHGQRHTFSLDEKCVQHDWESYDADNALMRFRGAENCAVKECHFRNTAAGAIRLDLHCQKITVENNLIENIGGSGIVLCGYGPGTKDVNKNNVVHNNKITGTGQAYWHSPAIMIYQSGYNIVCHNQLSHTPYNALVITGIRFTNDKEACGNLRECYRQVRWDEIESAAAVNVPGIDNFATYLPFFHARHNRIEYNEIHHAVEVLGDGNGIYMSGCGIKNIIRRNYLHDIVCNKDNHSSSAIRTDSHINETAIVENIVYRCTGGGLAVKPFGNYCMNNIVANLIDANNPANPKPEPIGGYLQTMKGDITCKLNILYHKGKATPFYRELGKDKSLSGINGDYDIFYCPDDPNAAIEQLKIYREKDNFELHGIVGDPLFVDIEAENFLLKPESPALKMGFKQLDVKDMGLTKDFPENFKGN